MSDYTQINLMAIDDRAGAFGLAPQMELRTGSEALEFENAGISHIRLVPGWRQPFGHKQTLQEETYIVIAGSGRVKIEDDILELGPLDAVRVAPAAMRSFEAGPDGIELIAVGAPATAPGDGSHVVRWWTD